MKTILKNTICLLIFTIILIIIFYFISNDFKILIDKIGGLLTTISFIITLTTLLGTYLNSLKLEYFKEKNTIRETFVTKELEIRELHNKIAGSYISLKDQKSDTITNYNITIFYIFDYLLKDKKERLYDKVFKTEKYKKFNIKHLSKRSNIFRKDDSDTPEIRETLTEGFTEILKIMKNNTGQEE